MTAPTTSPAAPDLEVKVSPTGYTTLSLHVDRTVLKLRSSDAHNREALIAASLIIRDRIGTVDRTWKGNPRVIPDGVTIVLTNRMLTRERSFVIYRSEIGRRNARNAPMQAAA
ncbi:hypothetical protein [Nocardia sp. NPDC050435]|uniref:hypothetical protein n=1 Tax=Nocardia sp. NPDC050435 TaxID=3155040 RepID=UPI0033F5CC31